MSSPSPFSGEGGTELEKARRAAEPDAPSTTSPATASERDEEDAGRPDPFSPAQRSAVMRRVKSRDTGPEMRVRKLLTGLGVGYRLQRRDLPGRPDIVMAGRRLAIFVHGCFWHGHACRRGARAPKTNADYWRAKIARNRARDVEADAALTLLGWRSEIVWECELKDDQALQARLSGLTGGRVGADAGGAQGMVKFPE